MIEAKVGSAFFADAGVASPVPVGAFFDLFPVSVLTTSTLEQLRASRPQSLIDERRFRMNVIVGTKAAGFLENGWVNRDLGIGATARLHVAMPDPRCVMTTLRAGRSAQGHGDSPDAGAAQPDSGRQRRTVSLCRHLRRRRRRRQAADRRSRRARPALTHGALSSTGEPDLLARRSEARPHARYAAWSPSLRRRRYRRRAAHPRPRADLLGSAAPGRRSSTRSTPIRSPRRPTACPRSLETLDERWKAGRSGISCPTSAPGCTAARPSSSPASASPSAARAR